MRRYFDSRMGRIEQMLRHPIDTQHEVLTDILQLGEQTDFGRRYEIDRIETVEDFQRVIPLSDYDSMGDYMQQMLNGDADVTARGRIKMFVHSSREPLGRSKFTPITRNGLWGNYLQGICDMATLYLRAYPDSHMLDGKILLLSGSCSRMGDALAGDLSALLMQATRFASGWLRLPKGETALLHDFEEKIRRIYRECRGENITAVAGIPSQAVVLMRRVLEYSGKSDLHDVWSGLELFVCGGEDFMPHRKAFAEGLPNEGLRHMEVYASAEGLFAIAEEPMREDMLPLLGHGIFYEFRNGDNIVPLEGAQKGIPYAMIITSTNGLWRYDTGDIVEFTSTDPYRFRVLRREQRDRSNDVK